MAPKKNDKSNNNKDGDKKPDASVCRPIVTTDSEPATDRRPSANTRSSKRTNLFRNRTVNTSTNQVSHSAPPEPTPDVTYSSGDSVRLAFLIAGLNDLDILACDVTNAYLNAPCRKKVWFVGGKDTGEDFGKVCVVEGALYGLKSSGASWRNMLAETIVHDLGFEPTRADSDVYRRPAEKDGFEYYEYIFVYVDDVLVLSKDPRCWINRLQAVYEIREDTIHPPEIYLGAMTGRHNILFSSLTTLYASNNLFF